MVVVVMVTVCARDNLQKFLFIMLELCLVPDVAYYARFSARLICGCLNVANACLQNANVHNYTAVQTYNIATGAVSLY